MLDAVNDYRSLFAFEKGVMMITFMSTLPRSRSWLEVNSHGVWRWRTNRDSLYYDGVLSALGY
jgi:hypothetical protein